jgi:hypothetical protein
MSTSGYTTNYDQTGSIVGAKYSLSKRTNIIAQYYSFTGGFTASTNTSTAGTSNGTGALVLINNSF